MIKDIEAGEQVKGYKINQGSLRYRYKGRLVIPLKLTLVAQLLRGYHDTPGGIRVILKLISSTFKRA